MEPESIRVDNGPEFLSSRLNDWCLDNKVRLAFIQPGKPIQNGYVERFNGSVRRELPDAYVFRSLDEVRQMADEWRNYYNTERPHQALGGKPPVKLLEKQNLISNAKF